MTRLLGVQLEDTEERCAVIRRDVRALLLRCAFGIAWTLLPSFFFFPLLRMGWFGGAVAVVLTLGGLVYLMRVRTSWFGTAIVATTHRCIDVTRKGFAKGTAVSVPWEDVAAVETPRRSVLHIVLGVGTLRVVPVAKHPFLFELTGVRNVGRVQQLLNDVQCVRTGKTL